MIVCHELPPMIPSVPRRKVSFTDDTLIEHAIISGNFNSRVIIDIQFTETYLVIFLTRIYYYSGWKFAKEMKKNLFFHPNNCDLGGDMI